MTDGSEFIFVGGAPRSGTTLVQNMLDSHPSIAGGPEFDNLPAIIALRRELRASWKSGRTTDFTTGEGIDDAIRSLIEQLLIPFMAKRGASRLSEKTPSNVLVFDDLLDLYPQANFVLCLRDPRAVVASMLEVGRRGQAITGSSGQLPAYTVSVLAAVETIRQYNRAGFAALSTSDRVHVVRYEQLVQAPLSTARALIASLGLTWDDALLSPSKVRHAGERLVDAVWAMPGEYGADPFTDSVEKWKASLGFRAQKFIEWALAGEPFADDFGLVGPPLAASLSRNMAPWVDLGLRVRRRIRHYSSHQASGLNEQQRKTVVGTVPPLP